MALGPGVRAEKGGCQWRIVPGKKRGLNGGGEGGSETLRLLLSERVVVVTFRHFEKAPV